MLFFSKKTFICLMMLAAVGFVRAVPVSYSSLSMSDLQKLAETGDAKAQAYLGNRFEVGRDMHQAVAWYEKAANANVEDVGANLIMEVWLALGRIYAKYERNRPKAFFWLLKAAKEGNREAPLMLWHLYNEEE